MQKGKATGDDKNYNPTIGEINSNLWKMFIERHRDNVECVKKESNNILTHLRFINSPTSDGSYNKKSSDPCQQNDHKGPKK